jgi:uncharacterized membrane protein
MSGPESPGGNPWNAPAAPVADVPTGDAGAVVERGRALPIGRGLAWYGAAWRLFSVAPLAWVGIWVLFAVCAIVVSIIPLLGMFANALLGPIFVGGIMLAARSAERSGTVPVGLLFAAFGSHAGPLALVGLLQLVAAFLLVIIFGIVAATIVGTTIGLTRSGAAPDFLTRAWLPFVGMGVAFAIVYLPIAYATWLAAALIALHDIPAIDALRMGFVGMFRNVLPLAVFALLGAVLAVLASLPVLLGWFVLGPVFLCSLYVQYRDVYTAPA